MKRTSARGALVGVALLSLLAAAMPAEAGFAQGRDSAAPAPAAAQPITSLALDNGLAQAVLTPYVDSVVTD